MEDLLIEPKPATEPGPGPLFTVFTATLNRAHTLPRVLDCLERQTLRDFEWLIVDDGSTDDTRALVADWRSRTDFPVRYVYQDHAGKHVAFNRGVREAAGRFFLPLDSDDGAVPQALERFKFHWESIPAHRRERFSAVTALRMYENGAGIGERFAKEVVDSESLEQYFKYRARGDTWGFQRTSILKSYPFPEPPGFLYVSESVVWFAIARRFKTRFVNDYLGINYEGDTAQPRMSSLTVASAQGRLVFHKAVIEDYLDKAVRAPRVMVESLINYSRYSFITGVGPSGQLSRMRSIRRKALVLSAIPFGYIFYVRDRSSMSRG